MHIRNFIQINDWDIRSFFAVVLGVQAACLAVIIIGIAGFELAIIRPFVGLIYLTFVPGYLALRALKMHKLGNVETPLYAVGLSVAIAMAAGFVSNVVYPILGISRPLTTDLLLATVTAIVSLLCVICYIRDRDFSKPDTIDVTELTSAPALSLYLLPFLSIFGTHLLTVYNNNVLSLALLVIIAAMVLLIGFGKFIPPTLYPLAIFSIAVSLLWSTSLVSTYLWGWDIQSEYYFANVVLANGYWDPTVPFQGNAILSTIMLGPLYANIANVDLVWVFKAVYPFLYAFVPLGMFVIFEKQMNDKIATLSTLFFVSVFTFYNEMPALARQEIAELFLILILVAVLARNINATTKIQLSLVFAFSLIVSHYALSYLTMFLLVVVVALYKLSDTQRMKNILGYRSSRVKSKGPRDDSESAQISHPNSLAISLNFVLVFIVVTFVWYLYVSGAAAVAALIGISHNISGSIYGDFLSPQANPTIAISQLALSPLHAVARYLQYVAQLLIAVGFISYFGLKRGAIKCYKEYALFCVASFALLILALMLPFLASAMNVSRIYDFALLFLAPFFVVGSIESVKALRALRYAGKRRAPANEVSGSLQAVSVFIAIFLLFNTGFVYEVVKDRPTSMWLSNDVDYPHYSTKEVQGANWLTSAATVPGGTGNQTYGGGYRNAYADDYRWQLLASVGLPYNYIPSSVKLLVPDRYVYLGTYNIDRGQVLVRPSYTDSRYITNSLDEIYDNGGSQIYR